MFALCMLFYEQAGTFQALNMLASRYLISWLCRELHM